MSVFAGIKDHGIVPVVVIDDPAHAVPMADALIAGGLPLVEVTLRTDAGIEAIAAIARHRPDTLVGAGTVLTPTQVDQCFEAGARFGFAPGLDLTVVARAATKPWPFAPGVMTPSDLSTAVASGCTMVKFFPAGPAGGPDMLKSIAAPFAHTSVGFNPTGGITLETLDNWITMPEVHAVGGSWIAPRPDIAAGNWSRITDNARRAVLRVKHLREN